MKIDTEKTAKFFSDFKSIWGGIFLLLAGLAFASDYRNDNRYMKIAAGDKIVQRVEISALQQRVEELEIQKSFEKDPQKIKMLDALINIKKSKMELLRK